MITIQELLYNRGLDRNAKVKLVRHKDARCDLYEKYRTDPKWFYAYQRSQENPVFKNTDYIVSFIGEKGITARFIGVYQVSNEQENTSYNPDTLIDGKYIYDMQEVAGFEDLKDRVIIKWRNASTWHQWNKNEMEVIEIQPGLHYN
jgi:hypothetical protein